MSNPFLSVVIPVYNEIEVLPYLSEKLKNHFHHQTNVEFIFIDDASIDGSIDFLSQWSQNDTRVRIIFNHKNIGHQPSLYMGLLESKGEIMVSMDADLQDPVELISLLVEKYKHGYDIVHAQRTRAGASTFRNICAWMFYRVLKLFNSKTIVDVGDFRLISRKALQIHQRTFLTGLYLRGEFSKLPLRQAVITYKRSKRIAGESKYTFRKLFSLALAGFLKNRQT
jgi:glycosyltransferase involved in cell wall biosynthesis